MENLQMFFLMIWNWTEKLFVDFGSFVSGLWNGSILPLWNTVSAAVSSWGWWKFLYGMSKNFFKMRFQIRTAVFAISIPIVVVLWIAKMIKKEKRRKRYGSIFKTED